MSVAGKIARRTFVVAAVGGVVAAGTGFARLRWIDGYKLPTGKGETSFGAWLKFAPDGKVEVAGHDGKDHKDDAIAIAREILVHLK